MRTTDVVVTALFSPSAVVAIGLADLYARFPLRIGLGLGGGAIALSSQGAGATETRDEAITQAILLGALAGVPFVLFGLFLGEAAIGVFGRLVGRQTPPEVVALADGWMAVVVAVGFRYSGWAPRAAEVMAARGGADDAGKVTGDGPAAGNGDETECMDGTGGSGEVVAEDDD